MLAFLWSWSVTAHAFTDSERAAARQIAQQGINAYAKGDLQSAVELLERAESIIHAPTHLLYIARAQAELGHFVEAREAYTKVINESLPSNASKAWFAAQKAATSEVITCKQKIGTLTVDIQWPGPSAKMNLSVLIDDTPLSLGLLDSVIPMNPGQHRIVVKGPELIQQEQVFELSPGEAKSIHFQLKFAPVAPTSQKKTSEPAQTSEPKPRMSNPPSQPKKSTSADPDTLGPAAEFDQATASTQSGTTFAWGTIGAGAVLVGTSAAFGIGALNQLHATRKSDRLCPDYQCTPEGRHQVNAAKTKALVSDISLGAGIIAIGVGTYLLITRSPRPSNSSPTGTSPSPSRHVDARLSPSQFVLCVGGQFK